MYSPWHEWYIVSYDVSELTLSTLCCVMLEQLYARMRQTYEIQTFCVVACGVSNTNIGHCPSDSGHRPT